MADFNRTAVAIVKYNFKVTFFKPTLSYQFKEFIQARIGMCYRGSHASYIPWDPLNGGFVTHEGPNKKWEWYDF